jgi:hypothetical protein
MGGAQLGKKETYGRYDIIGYIESALDWGNEFVLKARTRQTLQDSPRILRVTLFYEVLETGFSLDEETVWKEVLGRIHGLLDFGLFEESNEYQWTVTPTRETIEPPLTLEAPDFGGDSERRICYHILSALRRARRELPREYTRKKLDPEGVCAILQIAREHFEYIVGRLGERGWITGMQLATDTRILFYGNLFDGEFYITEEGVQALEEMERSQVKPQWLTKRAPEDVQKHVPEIVQVIDNWIPKQRYRTEEAYRAALAEHLEGYGITAPEEQGASLTDILAAHGIGIETKLKPDRSEYDRLTGQILRQLGEFGVVVVLILRPDRRDLLDEYKSLFAGDDRVVFMTK